MKEVWQIEAIDPIEGRYWYLKAEGGVTDNPAEALEFKDYTECENYRKKRDFRHQFHSQKMVRG